MNSEVLDKIQGLNNDLENGNSIVFELNEYISQFIKIITPDYKDENQTITEKIDYLIGIEKPIKYKKEDMEKFVDDYHDSLKGAIEKTTKLKPTELVEIVDVDIVNNKQPNSTPDDTDLSLQNKKLDKFDGTFGEEQESSGCGRHTLNNLLGHAYFTGYNNKTNENPYTLDELKDIIENITEKQLNLDKLCKYLDIRESNITDTSEKKPCPVDGNYNINVLIIALGLVGFEINNIFKLNEDNANKGQVPNIYDANVFGLLINIGGAHWVSAREYDNEIYYMNSTDKNVTTKIEKKNLDTIIMNTNNTIYTIINTNNPKIAFINLKIDDFIRTAVPVGEKEIYYNQKYIDYIKELKNKDIINNLYNEQFQHSQKLTSLIQNKTKNGEEILKQLLREPIIVKPTNDPPKKNAILAARSQISKQIQEKNKSQKKKK